jgi:Flp pilus assembly protein TadG
MNGRTRRKPLRGSESGAVAIEFAILGPVFLVLLMGIMVWGQYFWIAHAVQQLANDSARVALAGLDPAEREALARNSLKASVGDYASLKAADATMTVDSQADRIVVSVRYDTSDAGFRALTGLVPSPPPIVLRQASVRLGGY